MPSFQNLAHTTQEHVAQHNAEYLREVRNVGPTSCTHGRLELTHQLLAGVESDGDAVEVGIRLAVTADDQQSSAEVGA